MRRNNQDKLIIDMLIIIKKDDKYIGCLEYLYGPSVKGLLSLVSFNVYNTVKSIINPNKNVINPMKNHIVFFTINN